MAPPPLRLPHTPSPRPHLLRYVPSRGNRLQCIQCAYEDDDDRNRNRRAGKGVAHKSLHSERTLWVHSPANAVSSVTTLKRGHLLSFVFAIVFGGAACGPALNEVRIEPGTAPLKPIFVLTDTTGRAPSGTIYGMSVVPCGADTAVWQIAASGSNGAPARLVYGETPPGYVVSAGPVPLHTGCYDVFVTDGRRARFRVDAAGRVVVNVRRDTTTR